MSWVLAIAGFMALIVLHEAGHFVVAKAVGMRVERFYLFFPPKLVSFTRGETEYGIGAIPLGGFVKITGMNPDEELPPEIAARGYYSQPVWKRIVVIAAGPAVNLVIAFVIFAAFFMTQDEPSRVAVDAVEQSFPAAGKLQEGDVVLSVDGKTGEGLNVGERAQLFVDQVRSHSCPGEQVDGCVASDPVEIVVERDGDPVSLRIRPEFDAELEAQRLGFSYIGAGPPISRGVGESADQAVDTMWEVTSNTIGVLVRLFEAEQREQLSGVVGITEVTRQTFEFDTARAIFLLGLVSLSLAIINLFPFLPLDGGHIFWSVVEKLRGKKVAFSVMERASVIGFALVLVIFAIGLSNDIGRLTGEGFEVR